MTRNTTITENRLAGPTAKPPRRNDDNQPGETPFASLVSAVLVQYGSGVQAARVRASAGRAFSAQVQGDARTCRLDQMTASARQQARQAGGRHAALSDTPETHQLSGRAQRLGVEKESTADPHAGRARQPVTNTSHANQTQTATTQYGNTETPSPHGGDQANNGLALRDAGTARSGQAVNQSRQGQNHINQMPTNAVNKASHDGPWGDAGTAASPATPRVSPARVPANAADTTPTVAKQIAQLLGAKAEGAELARNTEASATLRSGARSAPSATAHPTAKKTDAPAQPHRQNEAARSIFDKLVRNIRINIGTRQSTARIRLHPPELGQVRVDVKLVDARIDIRVEAENPIARELLSERIESLRSTLRDHGLIPQRLELVDPPHDGQTYTTPGEGDTESDFNQAYPPERHPDDRGEEADGRHQTGSHTRAEDVREDDDTTVTVLDARLDIHI
ncbi:MAG: flagellar hook-length control protein FliK [Phycisphaerae bacterium]|nr:flagellar hook-length control protein FliK [Phycisphaerae bacterium]